MKKYALIFTMAVVSLTSQAQQIAVHAGRETIHKVNREGISTSISMDEKRVAKAWENYLRNSGKVDYSKGVYTVEVAKIPAISDRPVRLISVVNSGKNATDVFCAIDIGSAYVTAQHPKYREAENFMQSFVKKLFQDEVAEQLKDAEKDLATAVKKRERSAQEGDNLVRDIERNKSEKEALERKLQENKVALEKLQRGVESNKKEQAEAESEVVRNQRIVDDIKRKYALIN
jgi:hypothetical protein